MTWLTPWLAGAAASVMIPALIILYFLKLRRRDVEISTTLLWKKAIQDMQANAPFQRLRRNILLFLQLIALTLGLLALGQPELRAQQSPGGRFVIMIDRSASMKTTDALDLNDLPISRLDRAKLEASALVETMSEPSVFGRESRDEAMVIALDAGAEVVQSFTADKARLLDAIAGIQARDATSELDEAVRLAGAYAQPVLEEGRGLVAQPTAPIHLWSDGRIADAADVSVTPGVEINYRRVGDSDTVNLGITAFRAERAYDDPRRVSVFVGVQSTAPVEREVDVELSMGNVVAAIKTIRIPAADDQGDSATSRATSGVVFRLERTEGALLRVAIDSGDQLADDDEAWLVLPPARRFSVLYVAPSPSLLLDALQSLELSKLTTATPAQYERMITEGADGAFDVIVLDRWAPADQLAPGSYLIVGAAPGSAESLERPDANDDSGSVIIDWRREHPALRNVSFDAVFLTDSIKLPVEIGSRVLAQSDKGAVIVEQINDDSRAMLVGFDVMKTTLVWDYNIILFLASTMRHLGGEFSVVGAERLQPGGAMSARLPVGAQNVSIKTPDGDDFALAPTSDGRVTFGPTERAGLYLLRWVGEAGSADATISGDRRQRAIALNLLDPFESQVGAAESIDLASTVVQDAADTSARDMQRRKLWPWLLLSALGVVMLEWWVYNRKVQF